MGIEEILLGYVRELEPSVKRIIIATLRAERKQLDLDRPRGVKDEIKEAIEKEARAAVAEDPA